jgi:hypothetical protein
MSVKLGHLKGGTLEVFKSELLREIFAPDIQNVGGAEENCVTRSSIIQF